MGHRPVLMRCKCIKLKLPDSQPIISTKLKSLLYSSLLFLIIIAIVDLYSHKTRILLIVSPHLIIVSNSNSHKKESIFLDLVLEILQKMEDAVVIIAVDLLKSLIESKVFPLQPNS